MKPTSNWLEMHARFRPGAEALVERFDLNVIGSQIGQFADRHLAAATRPRRWHPRTHRLQRAAAGAEPPQAPGFST